MTPYDEYKKLKEQKEVLEARLKEVEQSILDEIKNLSKPFKTDYGTFTKVTSTKYQYTEAVKGWKLSEEVAKKVEEEQNQLKALKLKEERDGIATKVETLSLRFIKNK